MFVRGLDDFKTESEKTADKRSVTSKETEHGSSVGRACDFLSGGDGFDPRSDRPLTTGWVGVSRILPGETKVMVSPLCLCVAARNDISL